MARTFLHGDNPFNRAQRDRLIAQLDPSTAYCKRLSSCGSLSMVTHGYKLRCGLPPCPSCRSMYATRQRRAVKDRFVGASNKHAAMITVVGGIAEATHELPALIAKMRKDLRNLVDSQRRKTARWNTFRCTGWLETDALDPGDFPLLGSERADLLSGLGAGAGLVATPIWIPTVNLIARFDGMDWKEVQRAFSSQWPVERQAFVRPFFDHLTVEQNCANTTNYALKHRCTVSLQGGEEEWPSAWMADYYLWLKGWSPSFKRTRFFVGMKRSKKLKPNAAPVDVVEQDDDDYGQQVVMVSSSVLPTLYNW